MSSRRPDRRPPDAQPIDRYYIEQFFQRQRSYIRGRVLEVVPANSVSLDQAVVGGPEVTHWQTAELDADSAAMRSLIPAAYETILLPGTNSSLLDLEEVIKDAARALVPTGVILAVLPCVAPIDSDAPDYWRFTPALAKRIFETHMGGEVHVEGLGNARAASAIRSGRVAGELSTQELDQPDAASPVVVGVRGVRPSWGPTDEADLRIVQARYPYFDEASIAPDAADAEFSVTAIISTYNEADIIEAVISHLVENGLEVYLIDNHSTDDTVAAASRWLGRGLVGIELFPEGAEWEGQFPWEAILARKTVLSHRLASTWVIHHDADEIRESPWPGVTMRDAIRWVDRVGYNAIDFFQLNFPPVDDRFIRGMDPRTHFVRWEHAADYDRGQVKCWRTGADDVELVDGGHAVRFSDQRVFPIPFVLRHYPVRGQTHGRRKVFTERRNRYLETELARGWHVQYDTIENENHRFLRNPASLIPFDLERVRLDVMLNGKDVPSPELPAASASRAEGFLDYVGHDRIMGWAWSGDPEGEPVSVDLWDGGHLLGTVRAPRFRADLQAAGKGSGHAGFVFLPSPSLADGREHTIWVNHSGTSVSLRGSPQTLAPSEAWLARRR